MSCTEDAQITTRTLQGGFKADAGKARFDLIPPRPLLALANLFGIGAVKYASRNWEKGMMYGRVFGALMRHAWKWWNGEDFDPVDGQHHLDSVAWCAVVLREYCYYAEERPGFTESFDDRWFTVRSRTEPVPTEAKPTIPIVAAFGGTR